MSGDSKNVTFPSAALYSVRKKAREIAATGLYAIVYDNININFANAEQILGRHDTQENGTCATLFTLNGPADIKDLDVKKLQRGFLSAPTLSLDDILLSDKENADLNGNLVATVLRIIVEFGGERFAKFKTDMEDYQPSTDLKVNHEWKTELYPLPAWNIDESSVQGNIEVNNAIVDELELRNNPEFEKRARILAGDQLTIARLRAIESLRAGNETGYEGFFWAFISLACSTPRSQTSMASFSTILGSPTPEQAIQAHFPSTTPASIASPLRQRPSHPSESAETSSLFPSMHESFIVSSACPAAHPLMITWRSMAVGTNLRFQRNMEMRAGVEKPTKGDMVFENAVLFMRDALISREFTDAIRSNDPGRIILILKIFALSFRGTGRVKYAYEMLFIIHHVKHIWPPGIRRLVFNNMVLNPSGQRESGVEADLVQEHMNLLSKAKYKARGSNASWEWMHVINPCTESLRELQSHINATLGVDIGKKHANAQLMEDIQCLMDSLQDHKVYEVVPGRVTGEDDPPVKDAISVGIAQLSSSSPNSPLAEYNAAFQRLQKRRRMTAVTAEPEATLTFTELPTGLGERIFPRTPSPPSPAGSSEGSPLLKPPPASTSPSTSRPTTAVSADEALAKSGPTMDELTDEIAEARHDPNTIEPLVEGELRQMMNDLEHGVGEETLARESLRDVAFDMDAVDSDFETESEDSSTDSDDNYAE
ncbi:hypothetical protein NMY22_g14184 [Coprinellus aureogranulatus]|nr:hypothetical protein NMY22_g14184 [Coprinellus aureogranulatus]